MRSRLRVLLAVLASAAVLALAVPGRAESTAALQDGQRIAGTVPIGEVIRLFVSIPEGAEPRLTFALKGSAIPVSFNRSDIYDPDGQLIPDTSRYFEGTRVRRNKSTLKLAGFVAPKSGVYEIVIDTNSGRLPNIVELRVGGRLRLIRETKIKAELDENQLSIGVGLQIGDLVRAKVKRLTGGVPTITGYVTPAGALRPPSQSATKKGGKTQYFRATRDDIHSFEFGYRVGSAEGDFAVVVQIKPTTTSGTAAMRLTNAPGIPLSVRSADRSTALNFGQGAPGLAYDGSVFLITALRPGPAPDIAARFYDRDLVSLAATPTPVVLAAAADIGPLDTIGGHRFVYGGNQWVLAFWTASGADAWVATFNRAFQSDALLARKTGLKPISASPGTPIEDPFLTTNGDRISFGTFSAPRGHDVHVLESDLQDVGTIEIGRNAYAHSQGAGISWNDDDEYFELWAPDSVEPTFPSDLHRQRYTSLWQPIGPDARPVADAGVTETMPTAVALDVATGATVVHYVVPLDTVTGDGEIHRVIFDADGVEVPGSRATLLGSARNRPTAVIVGNHLYLGSSSPSGPLIERYPLLR